MKIHQNTLKVRFDKIAKNIYLIFISCYKEPNNNNMYQFISGESWIRINASNRKCNLSKLHSIQDIIQIKSKLENVYEKKVSYTIIEIGNILTKKNNFEVNKLEKDLVYYKRLHYYNKLIGFGILFVIIYLVK